MKLEDIDGDLYITESLLETLKSSKPSPSHSPKFTVFASDAAVGTLKAFRSSPPLLELEFEATVEPGSLLTLLAGSEVKVTGVDFILPYKVGEIAYNVETSRCSVKAIHIEEVLNDRRDTDF